MRSNWTLMATLVGLMACINGCDEAATPVSLQPDVEVGADSIDLSKECSALSMFLVYNSSTKIELDILDESITEFTVRLYTSTQELRCPPVNINILDGQWSYEVEFPVEIKTGDQIEVTTPDGCKLYFHMDMEVSDPFIPDIPK
jgi:hypothetical protein